jgi:hypothetical protein
LTSNSSIVKTFGYNWNIQFSNSNDSNNPLSEIYIGISRPCGNLNEDYMRREVGGVTNVLSTRESNCHYDKNGKEHEQFYSAGFDNSEY